MKNIVVKGFLETVEPRWVAGWSFVDGQKKPIEVRLWIDGVVRARMVADQERKEMRSRGLHPTGRCGFRFMLEDLGITLPANCVIKVTSGDDDEDLWQSPWPYWTDLVKPRVKKTESDPALGSQFFFVHIPKTAGTSFGDMLLKVFPEKATYANQHDKKQNKTFFPSHNEYLLLSEEKLDSIRLCVGHVPYAIGQILPRQVQHMTFIRNPRERAISHLAFIHHLFPMAEGLSIEQHFHQIKKGQLSNTQVTFFADSDPYELDYFKRQKPLDSKAMTQALKHLDQCEFVGITEEFDASIALLEKMFGWKLGSAVVKNKLAAKHKTIIPDEILEEIDELNKLDWILYEAAKTRFERLKDVFMK